MMSINRILAIAATTTRLSTITAFTSSPITSTSTTTIARSFQTSTSLYSSPPTRYLLNYEYIPDVLEKRGPFREGHIGLAKDMIEKGTCIRKVLTNVLLYEFMCSIQSLDDLFSLGLPLLIALVYQMSNICYNLLSFIIITCITRIFQWRSNFNTRRKRTKRCSIYIQ